MKSTPLQAHFENKHQSDRRDRKKPANRLSLQYSTNDGGWRYVTSLIAGLNRWNVSWFPDSNIAITPDRDLVWDSLRIAAFERGACTVLTGTIEGELQEWLADPWPRQRERAESIQAGLTDDGWIRRFNIGTGPIPDALLMYTRLLGVRRFLTVPGEDGRTPLEVDGSDKSLAMSKVVQQCGSRSIDLARKGRNDTEKKGSVNLNDEINCFSVILHALDSKEDSILLTTDRDVLEIFYKAQWFIDTHYRSWLAAQKIRSTGLEPTKTFSDALDYFTSPIKLYARSSNQLAEFLPDSFETVHAGVIYVSPKEDVHTMLFGFETEMLSMLETRGSSQGRCTDLFGAENIHVDLGPLKPKLDGLYMGVGADVTYDAYLGTTKYKLPMLDVIHAINTQERFANC